jgi:hypothetical protein
MDREANMTQSQRSALAGGLLLVGLGVLFLLFQAVPALRETLELRFSWPLIVVAVGVFLLVMGVLVGAPDMAVPALIVGGIGGLLYWQNATGNWESWAYAWTLIPGFVGAGMLLGGVLNGTLRQRLGGGLGLVFISLVMFAIFGSLLGGFNLMGPYWPVLLILLGVLILIRPFLRA